MTETERNKGIDIARAGLIVYVTVVIHGASQLKLLPGPYWTLLLFEMPCIFMVSGYAYALFESSSRFSLTPGRYVSFCVKRSMRLLIPYFAYALVCAFIYLVYVYLHAGGTDELDVAKIFRVIAVWLSPYHCGRNHTVFSLSAFSWFVLPMWIVTLLLPLVVSNANFKVSLWPVALLTFVVLLLVSNSSLSALSYLVFYFFWAFLGYKLHRDVVFSRKICLIATAGAAGVLIAGYRFFGIHLNMQEHKFPPDAVFFTFSIMWVGALLFLLSYIKAEKWHFLLKNPLFRPFAAYGYSIYLWQGVGYSVSQYLSIKISAFVYIQLPVAVISSMVIASLFKRLEKVRFSKRIWGWISL